METRAVRIFFNVPHFGTLIADKDCAIFPILASIGAGRKWGRKYGTLSLA